MNNEDAINDPRYNQRNQQQEEEKDKKSRTQSSIEGKLKRKATKKLSKFLLRQGISLAARAATTAVSNPYVAIATGIIIFLVVVIIIMFGGGTSSLNVGGGQPEPTQAPGDGTSPSQPPIEGFNLTLTGPESVENGSLIGYTINYAYNESVASVPLDSITIYNDIPSNTEFVRASGNYEQSGGTISWSLEGEPAQGQQNITLRPTTNDTIVTNMVYARTSATQNPDSTETVPANNNTCNNTYDLNNPLGNFGDPNCNFSKDELYSLLQDINPRYANTWYYKIVPCESGYIPNAYNPNAVDPAGAWGLFQMGRGRNGEFDHGDVNWQNQTSNAVNYNSRINESFAYWECAR